MSRSPQGTLFVGTRDAGNVYALQDTDGDYKVDKKYTLITGMNMPNGVAFRDGDLYFAEIDKVWVWRGIESKLTDPGRPELISDDYPDKEHHGWKYIAFGPDGWLYVPVGGPCNICLSNDEIFASITRLNVETKQREIIAHGVRNTVGFSWHPVTNELWFTDNGGDWLGDDMPACELNYAPRVGMHFGYPFCHQGDFPDPKLGKGKSCADYTPPAQKLGPHVAPLGMEFYTGSMFPEEYKNQILIAEHGSWNRSRPIGYRVMLVRVQDNTRAVSYESFAEGWLEGDKAWGRPVDLEHLPDGSMLVSDDYANAIYRITYEKR
jgi:glucose/arabinose dehydrogenase